MTEYTMAFNPNMDLFDEYYIDDMVPCIGKMCVPIKKYITNKETDAYVVEFENKENWYVNLSDLDHIADMEE